MLLVAAVAVVLSCASGQISPGAGIDVGGMDTSIAPGDDFFAYTNGGWMKATPIPADKAYFGTVMVLVDETRKRTQALIEDAARDESGADADVRRIRDFYASYLDEAAIESKGITPLKPQFDDIAAIADRRTLARVIGRLLRADVDPLNNTNFQTGNLFGVWVSQALNDPSHTVPYFLQGGLGMPDRDYYLSPAPQMAELRKKYQDHISAIFKLAGFADPAARAARVYALETKMAKVHATRVESQDVHRVVSWKREELKRKAPGLDWTALLEAAGLNDVPTVMIWHPDAIPGLAALVGSEPLDSWKDWLVFHTIEHAGSFLPKAIIDELFAFHGKALNGIPAMRPRWQRGIDLTNRALGDAVGKLYVRRYFPPETKQKVQAMVNAELKAFATRIDALTWMSPETKAKAKEKLTTLRVGVGYPDRWRDYSGLEIVRGDALGNAERAELFEYRWQLAKFHNPVDRDEWWMTPQTVNAVNLPLQNALNFPAAYLQPPNFDPSADAAYNYGSMGATIGHEISHSFDDMGSQFDASGRLANWWQKSDFEHFRTAGEALVAQYDAYRPFPDLSLNGRQTLSENIADVAGLLVAYDAYRSSLNGQEDAVKDGFTGDQRFFISFGQSWRAKMRDAALRVAIATDGHAPDEYRADTVRNVDPWYGAFPVRPGQKLYVAAKDRVRIW